MFSLNFTGLFRKSWSRQRARRMPVAIRRTERQSVLRMECLEDRLLLAVTVNLGTAESFAVLGAATVTNTGTTIVTGDLGVNAGSAIVGFFGTLANEGPGVVVGGTVHEADAVASLAQGAVTSAYNDLAGRPFDVDLTGMDLGTLPPLTPGVYFFSSSAQLTGTVTLDALGDPDAEFIFQIGSTLITASNSSVVLQGGADSCNVYWQVGSSATLGTDTVFEGNILALASITLNTGATIVSGRALARNGAVTLDTNMVSINGCGSIEWEKRATDANPVLLGGATFSITPNPLTGMGTLIVVDGGANDADGLANGVLKVREVLFGTYTITETIAPPGYGLDDDATRLVTVSPTDLHAVIGVQTADDIGNTDESDFHNRLLGSIAWEKRATDSNPVLLAGATFTITPNPLTGGATLTVVDGGLNDADGMANGVLQVNDVLLGTYTITETVAPTGFAIDDDPTRLVTVSALELNPVVGTQGSDQMGDTDESDFHNRLGSVAWEKRATDSNPVLLAGATFSITPNPLTGGATLTVVDGGLNDADGMANGVLQVNNVRLGTYTITETVAPTGFALDDDATRLITVSALELNPVVGTQGSDQMGDTDESDFHNRLGSVAWEKRATDANPVLLGGATFSITPNPLTGGATLIVVDGGLNDADGMANGVLKVNNVLLGTYTITETVAPAGFLLDDDATRLVTVSTIDLNAVIGTQGMDNIGDTDESDFHNRLLGQGSIAWEKRATDSNPVLLAGATFVISSNPLTGVGTLTVVDGGVNDADGVANGVLKVNNVLLGTYTITETVAPAGYAIDDDPTRLITVSAADLNAVVGTQGGNQAGDTDESDFHNRLGSIAWEKRINLSPFPLRGGATFSVSPNPTGGVGTFIVVDNGVNDTDPDPGQIEVMNIRLGTYTITETVAPVGLLLDGDVTRLVTVSTSDLNSVIGVQGVDNIGTSDESDFHNRPVTVGISISDVTVSEGAGTATLIVSLSQPSAVGVSVTYMTADGSAKAGLDYKKFDPVLSFAPGETSKTVKFTILNDLLNELTESFFVNLSGAINATITDAQGIITIQDDDPLPSLKIDNQAVGEQLHSRVNAFFTVTLSAASSLPITVDYATADGTAKQPGDYVATSGTLTFARGVVVQNIFVPIVNDGRDDEFEKETLFVNLSHVSSSAKIAVTQGTGTIQDEDAAPTITINSVSVRESAGFATFTVSLSAASEKIISVKYATANGSALAGSDYTATSGMLTFSAGQISRTFTVPIKSDNVNEAIEKFFINLTSPMNASLLRAQGVGSILDG